MSFLELKNIYYENDNSCILNNISIDIEKGDCVSIVGPSGSGKSTLLKLCADIISPSKGHIYYREKSYLSYNPLDLRRKISYCVQIPYLFGSKVYENLEFPFKIRNEKVDNSKILSLINRFNLDESILQKEITALSGGEKQRIAIIRNLLYTPEILLLDESTSALDKDNAKKVLEYVKELNGQGVTVLWITHNLEESEEIFNKRIYISGGKLEKVEVLK